MIYDSSSRSSGMVTTFLKVGFSVALCAFIIGKIDLQKVAEVLSKLSIFSLGVAALLIVSSLLFASLRWQVLLQSQGHTLSYGFLCRIILIGFFFNQGLPSSIGGDIYRISSLGRQINSFAHAFMSVLLERLYGLLVFSLVAVIALLIQFSRFGESFLWNLCLLAFLGISAVFAFLVFLRFFPLQWRTRIESVQRLHFFKKFIDVLSMTNLSPFYLAQVFLWTFFSHGMIMASFVWLARELALPFGWIEAFTVVPITTIISSLPISFAGWGVREGIFVYALSYFAMSAEAALSLSLLYGVTQLLVAGLGLGLWLISKRYDNRVVKAAKA